MLQREYYFAEGTTRAGFDEYLTLQNPGDQIVNIGATYMLGTGQSVPRSYSVAAHSRYTVTVADEVGANQDVSVHLVGDSPFGAERPMYFNYNGWTGGHDVAGVTSPSTVWYFAEGSTRAGFDEYLCVQNPNGVPANVSVKYTEGTKKDYVAGPHSRLTIGVNGDVGPGKDIGTSISSDVPVVAERPMYFDYKGWTGGHTAVGQTGDTGGTIYLAEGTTRAGFDEYITIANPYESQTEVWLTFVFSDGSTLPWSPEKAPFFIVDSHSRMTIDVNDCVGEGRDVSARIVCGSPLVVERPMYFDYNGWTGGSDIMGKTDS